MDLREIKKAGLKIEGLRNATQDQIMIILNVAFISQESSLG